MRNNNIENRFDAKNIDLEIDKIADKVLKLINPSFKDLEKLKSIEKKIKDEIYSYKIRTDSRCQNWWFFCKGY